MKVDSRKHKKTTKDAYYNLGYEKFGPFLNGFMHWLREELKKEKYNKVFFMAREGYMINQAYDSFQRKECLNLDYEYAYFSRNSLIGTLFWTVHSFEESLKYMGYSKFISFSEIMAYYRFSNEEEKQIIANYHIPADEYFMYGTLAQNKKIKKIYDDYSDIIQKKSKEQYRMVLEYMSQLNMNGNIAIVDIGWHGTMQGCLEEIIRIGKKDVTVSGYYVGINPLGNLEGHTYGYLYSNGMSRMRKKLLCFLGVMETFFQGREGTTLYYKQTMEGEIIPVNELNEYEDDLQAQEKIKEIQKGAIQYIGEQSLTPSDFRKGDPKPFIRFGKNPTLKEVKMFLFLFNSDGGKSYYLPQKSLFRYKPNELLLDLSNSCWKTGFMKAVFKIPFPYFGIYEVLRK